MSVYPGSDPYLDSLRRRFRLGPTQLGVGMPAGPAPVPPAYTPAARQRVVNRTAAARFRGPVRGPGMSFADRLRPAGMSQQAAPTGADPLAMLAEMLPQLGLSQGQTPDAQGPDALGAFPAPGTFSGAEAGAALPPSVTGRDDPFLAQLADAVVNGTLTVEEAAKRYRARKYSEGTSSAQVPMGAPGAGWR